MKFNIMIVDGSMSVLESLQWLLMDETYYLFTFDNPLDALKVIKSLEWAVVVAGRSIPKMGGLEFLKKVRADSPHTMGIIMTDDNEIPGELDTSYSECVYRCVKKPLNKNEIKQAVKMAIAYYETNVGSKEHATSR
ncbi:MAG: response regulator [Proteobacteria bacterium]|jgi:DNA-binding NtrC family response regulator|nr:response regulator [Pseudomonadota bacterium]MBU1161524.1 response regulator [Pseudomonadota bacterium]